MTQVYLSFLLYSSPVFNNIDCLAICDRFSMSIQLFADFTIGMIGNETGHLLKRVKFYRKFININETSNILRRSIAATSLKISCTNVYSVKSYDETNMKVLHKVYGKI